MEGRPLEDTELVERANRGDVDACRLLVRRYQDLVARVGYLITGQPAEAEDAAEAYYALHRLRLGASFRPSLLRSVANEARNLRQAARRRAVLGYRLAVSSPGRIQLTAGAWLG